SSFDAPATFAVGGDEDNSIAVGDIDGDGRPEVVTVDFNSHQISVFHNHPVLPVNTLACGSVSGSPFCPGSSVNVPFTSTGTFNAGNIYTAQLSNSSGSFASPTAIGTLTGTANSGTIPAIIPLATGNGTG